MAHYRRSRPRSKPRCHQCTKNRGLGNSKARFPKQPRRMQNRKDFERIYGGPEENDYWEDDLFD